MPNFCHIDKGMAYLRIFVEDVAALLGALADKLPVVGSRKLVMTR